MSVSRGTCSITARAQHSHSGYGTPQETAETVARSTNQRARNTPTRVHPSLPPFAGSDLERAVYTAPGSPPPSAPREALRGEKQYDGRIDYVVRMPS